MPTDPDQLERGAEAIREAVAVYRGLVAVADMLDSFEPLEQTFEHLQARNNTLLKTVQEHEAAERAAKQKREAGEAEYKRSLALMERDFERRHKEFENELAAEHAEKLAALRDLDARIAEQTVLLKNVEQRLAAIRDFVGGKA